MSGRFTPLSEQKRGLLEEDGDNHISFLQGETDDAKQESVADLRRLLRGNRRVSTERGWFWGIFDKKDMSLYDSLRLSPWQKWRKYKRFPWKFAINVILIVLTTVQITYVNHPLSEYNRNQVASWQSLLRNETSQSPFSHKQVLFRIDEIVAATGHIIATYFQLDTTSLNAYEYITDEKNQILPVHVSWSGMQEHEIDGTVYLKSGSILLHSLNDPTPLSQWRSSDINDSIRTDIVDFVHSLHWFSITFHVLNHDRELSGNHCFKWRVASKVQFMGHGRTTLTTLPTSELCASEISKTWYRREASLLFFLYGAIASFAGIGQLLHLKAIFRNFQLYKIAMLRLRNEYASAERLSWSEKLKFFNFWFLIGSVGNICSFVGPILAIQYNLDGKGAWDSSRVQWRTFFLGLGCMMSWISIVQYFEHKKTYYILILTLRRGTPRVLRFVLGILPIFFGYALFGVAFFSSYAENFASLSKASVTLFSLLNGDVIHDVFDELGVYHATVSQIYLYTFISLFIYAVLNIFIAIIEDAFFSAKTFTLKSKDYLNDVKEGKADILDIFDAPPIHDSPQVTSGRRQYQLVSSIESAESFPGLSNPMLYKSPSTTSVYSQTIDEFIHEVMAQLGTTAHELTVMLKNCEDRVRPPHGLSFAPCGFDDCVYCLIYEECKQHLEQVKERFAALIEPEGTK